MSPLVTLAIIAATCVAGGVVLANKTAPWLWNQLRRRFGF